MQVSDKKAVALDYTLTIDDGIVVDASEKGSPLWYLHGAANIIPGLERELEGLEVGAKKTVVVAPEDGYGVRDEEKVHEVPKDQFPPDTTFELGDTVVAHAPDGGQVHARISAIGASSVSVDFNHQLAGKTLTFEIAIAEIRDASDEELQHGHIHGPGGHHH